MQHIWAIFNNNTHIPVHLPKFDEKENNQDVRIKRVDRELVSIISILFGKSNTSNGYNVVYV